MFSWRASNVSEWLNESPSNCIYAGTRDMVSLEIASLWLEVPVTEVLPCCQIPHITLLSTKQCNTRCTLLTDAWSSCRQRTPGTTNVGEHEESCKCKWCRRVKEGHTAMSLRFCGQLCKLFHFERALCLALYLFCILWCAFSRDSSLSTSSALAAPASVACILLTTTTFIGLLRSSWSSKGSGAVLTGALSVNRCQALLMAKFTVKQAQIEATLCCWGKTSGRVATNAALNNQGSSA